MDEIQRLKKEVQRLKDLISNYVAEVTKKDRDVEKLREALRKLMKEEKK